MGHNQEEEEGKLELSSVVNQDPWKAGYYEQQKIVNLKKKKSNVVVGEEEEQLDIVKDSVFLYPEKELVVEPEDLHHHDNNKVATTNGGGGGRKQTEYDEKLKALIAQYKARTAQEGGTNTNNREEGEEEEEDDLPESVLNELEDAISKEQRHFASFAARIAHEPAQCLRYCFSSRNSGGSGYGYAHGNVHPIWPSCHNIPGPADIPKCERCGEERKFEFQVMPQLINHLGVEPEDGLSPDWGIIAVYSCSKSCNSGGSGGDGSDSAYVEEFVWVQAGS